MNYNEFYVEEGQPVKFARSCRKPGLLHSLETEKLTYLLPPLILFNGGSR